jgi:hypothetical protein
MCNCCKLKIRRRAGEDARRSRAGCYMCYTGNNQYATDYQLRLKLESPSYETLTGLNVHSSKALPSSRICERGLVNGQHTNRAAMNHNIPLRILYKEKEHHPGPSGTQGKEPVTPSWYSETPVWFVCVRYDSRQFQVNRKMRLHWLSSNKRPANLNHQARGILQVLDIQMSGSMDRPGCNLESQDACVDQVQVCPKDKVGWRPRIEGAKDESGGEGGTIHTTLPTGRRKAVVVNSRNIKSQSPHHSTHGKVSPMRRALAEP